MPIYEYECSKCGQIQEELQRFSDKPLTKCSHCSGKMHKIVSQSTFHLKGTGWYVTDYATDRSKDPSSAKNESDAPAAKKAKSSTSADKKKTKDASAKRASSA